jgi:acetyltransferase-like isoleucine patch superfamily enzyme
MYHYFKTLVFYKYFFKKSGKKIIIINPIQITPSCISLSNNIVVRHHSRIEGVTKYAGREYTPEILINENVRIQQNLHLTCAKKIVIGKNAAIAANVTITDISHGYTDISTPPEQQPLTVKEVAIGDNCKLYNNVVILPGVILGKHNIVGANAVVFENHYPDYSVIVGSPARIVKRYNTETQTWQKTDSKGNFI